MQARPDTRMRVVVTSLLVLLAPALMAADAGATPGINSLAEAIDAGGWTMWVTISLSAIGLFLVFFFLLTLRQGKLMPPRVLKEANAACEAGDLEALRTLGQSSGCPAAKIMSAAAEQIAVSKQFDYAAVRDAVEDEGSRVAAIWWQRVQYLLDIAVIAPMVGFFGTVLGMLDSFAGMQVGVGAVRPDSIAHGVAKALITTVAGLIVGITAMILYAIFRGRLTQMISRLEETCSLLLRKFIGNYSAKTANKR